jgi:hypothetical protein
MTMRTKIPAVYADIEELPVGWVGEIFDDTLYAHPRATISHAQVESALGALLIDAFGFGRTGPGGWYGGWLNLQSFAGDEAVRAPPFHETALELGRLWIGP